MILKTELKDEKEIERFERALTSSRFGSRSAFLQHIISVYLLRSEEKRKPKFSDVSPQNDDDLEVTKKTIYVSNFLVKEAVKRADHYGMKFTVWVRNLIAANLTHQPIMTEQQIVELRAANRELASIGRNLNQIAKAMNQAVDLKVRDRVNYDHIVELQAGIEKQKKAIYKIVSESNSVWQVK
ncbi:MULTISPECIES: plasmid mobilization relaxosome protein MobC [Methylophaga]|uniref:Bacterial mobilisation domain-containing protein n=2 Tax=Methylophaga thalassica TaxID=40223 RepID=A0ABQ5TX77_9GAMM|nr:MULTISPECIES: plasmid mobilization relaxosome protein MobC [Methylophaga]AUZ86126.1 hypothetical protein CDW43_15860 [Methylophaga nitratireducenticrescens]GLQ00634.1 hypothetical protein GCM10007891_24870 [Methylophaga thalassica]